MATGNLGLRRLPIVAAPGHVRTCRTPNLLIRLGITCSVSSACASRRNQPSRWAIVVASTSGPVQSPAEEDEEDAGIGLETAEELDESELGPPPAVRYQRAMHIKDRKAWRAKAENMAKEKRLIKIQVGQLGITPSFLRACADILQKHTLVRVKLGEGCGLERRSAVAVLEKFLDCVCVHQIGFTITLYRQAGLPRPSNIQASDPSAPDPDVAAAAVLEAEKLAEEAAERRAAKKKAGQQPPSERPPEFSVL